MEKKVQTITLLLTKTELITIQGSLMGSRDTTSNEDLKQSFIKLLALLSHAKELEIQRSLKYHLKIQKKYRECNMLNYLINKPKS